LRLCPDRLKEISLPRPELKAGKKEGRDQQVVMSDEVEFSRSGFLQLSGLDDLQMAG